MIQNKILSVIPGYPEGAEVVADGDGAWQIIVEHSSADAWRGYCGKLAEAGFALLWERAPLRATFLPRTAKAHAVSRHILRRSIRHSGSLSSRTKT